MRDPPTIPPPRSAFASRLTRPNLLPAELRRFGGGVRTSTWLLVPIVLFAIVLSVRCVARVERFLSAEGTRAARVIAYELHPGQEFRVPIESGTDVFRIVCHAMRAPPLSSTPHVAKLLVSAIGVGGERRDEIVLDAPGTSERVKPEDREIAVGDPIGVNVDVHDVGRGELRIQLAAMEGADALLVRVYRRDALHTTEISRRTEHVDEGTKEHVAQRAGEVDWDDIDDPEEQRSLLGTRWRKVAALRGAGGDLVARAILLSAVPERARSPASGTNALLRLDVRPDERVAVVVHGASLRAIAERAPDATITAVVRRFDGAIDTRTGVGTLDVSIAPDDTAGVELGLSVAGTLAIHASPTAKIDLATRSIAWRSSRDRPVVVSAGPAPTVLRIAARAPIARSALEPVDVELAADVELSNGEHVRRAFHAVLQRSTYDRYASRRSTTAPTEAAIFYVVLSAGATVTLTPSSTLDLGVSELDPAAKPRPIATRPANAGEMRVVETGEVQWGGFVARSPTNAALFGTQGRIGLRIAHRFIDVPTPPPVAPSFRVRRPMAAKTLAVDGRIFEPSTASYELDVDARAPLVLPVRLFSEEPLEVVARIDGGTPTRKTVVLADRITTARVFDVDREVRAVVVLGDDLLPGRHVLTFEVPEGKKAWIHLPWLRATKAPQVVHWIGGQDE